MRDVFGTFAVGSKTASSGTAFAQLIPPWRGSAGDPPILYKLTGTRPNWRSRGGFTHLTQLVYTDGGTVHNVIVMRPLNWAVIDGDVAANSASITLKTDPGLYSTNYKYALPPEAADKVAGVANNAIAASDYVAYQLRDGTWVLDTVSSVSSLTLTMTTATPNISGGGVEDGSILFFFGVAADKDPATSLVHLSFPSVASTRVNLIQDTTLGDIPSLHAGDPMVIYSANGTAAGTLGIASGFYTER